MIERPPVITDQNLAIVMLDKSKRPNEKLSALIDKINDTVLEMTHEFHILFAEYEEFGKEKVISNLVDNCSLLSVEIVTTAHNAAIAQKQAQKCAEDAEKKPEIGMQLMHDALELNTKAISLVSNPLLHKEATANAINEYVIWLKELFGKGLNFEYKLANQEYNPN